jgi:hypothetical protein
MKRINILTSATIVSILFIACNRIDNVDGIVRYDPNNKQPIANAGADQVITLPGNTVVLDGTASKDPDGVISFYRWTKIAGYGAVIESPGAAITNVKNLEGGIYQFVLSVRDNGGSVDTDTVEVTVNNAPGSCDIKNRPQINAALTEIGSLSFACAPYVTAAANKIFFAGTDHYYAGVDIYDVNNHSWQRESLSQARTNMAIVGCGNKIFFAGGNNNDQWHDIIDIYDISNGNWTVAHLSEPKSELTAGAVGDKVFFAGGITEEGWNQTNKVDIYDISDDSWSIAELSEPKIGVAAVTAGNKIYFAGGWNYLSGFYNPMTPLHSVDIYDASANSWSAANLNYISGGVSGVSEGEKIYWSGVSWPQYEGNTEIWNTANGSTTTNCLSYPRSYPTAIAKNSDMLFFVPGRTMNNAILSDQFDIYNTATGKWSVGLLNDPIAGPGIISVNNVVYMGGGKTSNGYTDKVYILNW